MDLITKPVSTLPKNSVCPFCGGSGRIIVVQDGRHDSLECPHCTKANSTRLVTK